MGETITLVAEDGQRLTGYRAAPARAPRAGLVIVQEIFGVNSHIKRVCDEFTADGYVALAPGIFERVEPGFAIGYYGGGIADTASETPRCPVLLHFGETDQSIPTEHHTKIRAAHPTLPMHLYPAGHGFNCDERASYHEPSAILARSRTLDFVRRHLG